MFGNGFKKPEKVENFQDTNKLLAISYNFCFKNHSRCKKDFACAHKRNKEQYFSLHLTQLLCVVWVETSLAPSSTPQEGGGEGLGIPPPQAGRSFPPPLLPLQLLGAGIILHHASLFLLVFFFLIFFGFLKELFLIQGALKQVRIFINN